MFFPEIQSVSESLFKPQAPGGRDHTIKQPHSKRPPSTVAHLTLFADGRTEVWHGLCNFCQSGRGECPVEARRGGKILLELELQVIVSLQRWMLGTYDLLTNHLSSPYSSSCLPLPAKFFKNSQKSFFFFFKGKSIRRETDLCYKWQIENKQHFSWLRPGRDLGKQSDTFDIHS